MARRDATLLSPSTPTLRGFAPLRATWSLACATGLTGNMYSSRSADRDARTSIQSPTPDGSGSRLTAACAPFAWLGATMLAAAVLALALPLLLPGVAPQTEALATWNPFYSAVELELLHTDRAELEAFAVEVAAMFPEHAVELDSPQRPSSVAVIGPCDAASLSRELRAFARERGHETGTFSMGSNLARMSSSRMLEDPAVALQAGAALLPLALFSSAGVLLLFGALLRRRLPLVRAEPRRQLSALRKVTLGVGLGLLLALAIAGLSLLAAALGAPITEQPWLREAFVAGGSRWWLVLSVVLLLAPLGEEVFFRGYLLPALVRPWGRSGSVLLSSAAFAAIHGHASALPAYFVYGLGLALAARRTESLVVPVVAHVVVNSLAVAGLVRGAS